MVLVPGLTGSALRVRTTGEVVWGEGRDLVLPRDHGYNAVLPIAGPVRLEAFAVLDELRLGPVRRGIYGPLLDFLERHGYRPGRPELLDDLLTETGGDPGATLYTFAYDWRQSAVPAAGALAAGLERLRQVRMGEAGDGVLDVDLICQSSGGYVCRWLAKYGGATLEQAEAGEASPLAGVRIRHMVLVGCANGGALRNLREMDRGRSYIPLVGRSILPEVLFTFPSLYEDLPHEPGPMPMADLFVDETGRRRPDLDVYDPATWRRFGWSAMDPRVARRIEASGRRDLFGTAEERRAFLARSLDRAERFQRLLAADPPGFDPAEGGTRIFLVGNAYAETPKRAVLRRGPDGWETLFAGDRALRKRVYLEAVAAGPGDGHATVESMHALSPRERAAVADEPFYIHGGHFEMILEPATHRRILEELRSSGSPLLTPTLSSPPGGGEGATSRFSAVGLRPADPPAPRSSRPAGSRSARRTRPSARCGSPGRWSSPPR